MSDFEKAEQSSKGSLRETLRALRAAFAGAYALRPGLFVAVAIAFIIALTQVIPVMHSSVLYAAVAAAFFLILGCVVYAKKGAVEAMVSFAVGMFTAFTVPWDRSYFIIFAIAILLFIVLIIFLSSIKLAAAIQSTMTMAANFYTHQDHESNLRELKAVNSSGEFGGTLLPVERAKAVLFFAQRKVPTEVMKDLVRYTDQMCTVTQVDQVKIETMLYKVYQTTALGDDFGAHLTLVQDYLLEGPASPEDLVDAFIHTSFFVLEKPMPFDVYLSALIDGIAKGYSQQRLYTHIEQIRNAPKPEEQNSLQSS